MGGRGGHRRVTGLTGQERSAVFSHGHGSSERERLRHSHQPSFHKTFPSGNRLQARAPESPGGVGSKGKQSHTPSKWWGQTSQSPPGTTQAQGQPRAVPCGRGGTEYVSLGRWPGLLCHLQRRAGPLCGPR